MLDPTLSVRPASSPTPELNVIGLSVREARAKLRARGLAPGIARFADGRAGRVLAQMPIAGVAAAPRMTVRLVVGHG